MIRIAQAASSEYGTKWGVPPNQRRTGATEKNPGGNMDGELNVVPFSTNGWRKVYRAKNKAIGDRIAWIMERAVMNGSYFGYGQNNGQYPRTGVFDELFKMSKPDPMEIKTLVNCDCSSLAGAAVYHAGVYMLQLRDMNTATEPDLLMRTGEFIELDDQALLQSAAGIRRGDILWKPGHTAVALDTDEKELTTPCIISDCFKCNLRSGPGTEYGVIKELDGGTIVWLISRASNGWAQVRVDGATGYVSPKYYSVLPTATAKGDVWLRTEPKVSPETEIVVIPKNATAYLTGQTKRKGLTTWHESIYLNKQGWASGKYLKK